MFTEHDLPIGKHPAAGFPYRVYDVSADGKRFLFTEGGAAAASPQSLTLVVNWAAELKR